MLKKEFKKRDVTRIRNIVKGKARNKTMDSIGYTPKIKIYKEGNIWEEDGKKWIMKEGIKRSFIKAKKLKNLIKIPLFCPSCEGIMNNRHDKAFYIIHKKCFNCVITMESELKRKGEWEGYQIKIHNNEIDNTIKEFKSYVKEKLNENNEGFISEDGDLEKWVGSIDKERVDIYTGEVVEYLENLKK